MDERINAGTTIDAILPAGYSDATGNTPIKITVACEFKAAGTPGQYDTILGAMNGFTWSQGLGLYWESSTAVRAWFRNYAGQKVDITGLTATNWNHVVFTYDYNSSYPSSRTIVKAYLNGVLFGTYTSASNFYNFLGTTNTFRVGADNDSSTYFNGYVRRVGIWKTVLSPGEIRQIYQTNAEYTIASSSDLLLYWKGYNTDDVTAASGVLDSSGNARHGTGSNMESADLSTTVRTDSAATIYNTRSMRFDGSNDYVNIPYASAMKPNYNVAFSVSVWYRKNSSGNFTIVGNTPDGNSNIPGFYISESTNLYYYFCESYGTGKKLEGDVAAPLINTWHHIVFTHDGTGTDAGCHLYLDGVDQTLGHPDSSSPQSGTIAGTNPWRIGGKVSYTNHWPGNVDDFYYYSVALSQADVTALYNNGIPPDPTALSSWSNAVAGYRLGDGSDTTSTVYDIKGSNNATPTNGPTITTDCA